MKTGCVSVALRLQEKYNEKVGVSLITHEHQSVRRANRKSNKGCKDNGHTKVNKIKSLNNDLEFFTIEQKRAIDHAYFSEFELVQLLFGCKKDDAYVSGCCS